MERRNFIKGILAALGVASTASFAAPLPKPQQAKIGCADIGRDYEQALKQVGSYAQHAGVSLDELNEACRLMSKQFHMTAEAQRSAMTKLFQSLA